MGWRWAHHLARPEMEGRPRRGKGVSIEVGNSSETSRDGGGSIDKDGIES